MHFHIDIISIWYYFLKGKRLLEGGAYFDEDT